MLCSPWGGIFGSGELWYPIRRTGDKQGVLQVTPFVDFGKVWTNSGGRATLEANSFAVSGIGLAVAVRPEVECSRRLGNSFD